MQIFDRWYFPFALGNVQKEYAERGPKAHGPETGRFPGVRSMNRQLYR